MLKAIFNGLVKFISGLTVGTCLGVVLIMWTLDKFEFLDYKELARYWIRRDKKKNAD